MLTRINVRETNLMIHTTFYKKRLIPQGDGLIVWTEKFISVHETVCFHFCVTEYCFRLMFALKRKNESPIQYGRRMKCLKRIAKSGSRIAFKSESEALDNLRFLKRKQLNHIKRDQIFIETFLACEELEQHGSEQRVPSSADLVREYYQFD